MRQTITFQTFVFFAVLFAIGFSSCKKDHFDVPEQIQETTSTTTDWNSYSGSAASRSECPVGDIVLTTQSEVDNFAAQYPNCLLPDGSIFISGEENSNDPITSLVALSFLQGIGGDLVIENNEMLENFEGLHNITTIGGDLRVESNEYTEFMDGLESVDSIGGDLIIENNNVLVDLSDLESLECIGGGLEIKENAAITSILPDKPWDCPNWPTRIVITGNPQLSTCAIEGTCEFLDNGGQATISNNAQGCNSLEEVQADCAVTMECGTFTPRSWVSEIQTTEAEISVDEVLDANKYKIKYRIAGNSNSGSIVQSTNNQCCLGLPVLIDIQDLETNTTYKYRVKYHCPNGWSAWSDPQTFTTLP